jgi:hypothetical protein
VGTWHELGWDDTRRERFRELRRREDKGALTPEEQTELSRLIQEIEDAEAAYLRPATECLRREREAIEAQNSALQALLDREEALVAHLETVVASLQAERKAINEELVRVTDQRPGPGTAVKS